MSEAVEENKLTVVLKILLWEFDLNRKFICTDEIMTKVKRIKEINPSFSLCEMCPSTEFFLVCIFPHSNWIRRDTSYLSVFYPNTGKHGPEETPYLDTFPAMFSLFHSSYNFLNCWKITKPITLKFSNFHFVYIYIYFYINMIYTWNVNEQKIKIHQALKY